MKKLSTFLLFLIFLGAVSLSLNFGSSSYGVLDLLKGEEGAKLIVSSLRLPRVLGAILSGAALSVAGMLLQSATGNDLASPNIIGVNSGSGLFVVLLLAFLPKFSAFLPLAAFLGSLLSVFLVLGIKEGTRSDGRSGLVLAGVAVNALFNAGILTVTTNHNEVMATYASFQAGGFSGIFMDRLYVPGVMIAAGILMAYAISSNVTKLTLGDELASSLGVNTRATRRMALLLGALLSSCAVVICGLLGFVGLIVPHMTKRIYGERVGRRILPSILLSSSLLLLADLLGRIVFRPSELSAGIFMAFLGVPFFIYLLSRRHHG